MNLFTEDKDFEDMNSEKQATDAISLNKGFLDNMNLNFTSSTEPEDSRRMLKTLRERFSELTNPKLAAICNVKIETVRSWYRSSKALPMTAEAWYAIWKFLFDGKKIRDLPLIFQNIIQKDTREIDKEQKEA